MKRNRQGMLKAKLHETSHFRFQPNNNVPCVGRWNRWYASIFKYKTVQCMKMRKIHNGGCYKQLLVDCSPDNRCSFATTLPTPCRRKKIMARLCRYYEHTTAKVCDSG